MYGRHKRSFYLVPLKQTSNFVPFLFHFLINFLAVTLLCVINPLPFCPMDRRSLAQIAELVHAVFINAYIAPDEL